MAGDGAGRNHPQPAPLFAKREFQQNGVLIEQSLDVRDRERLGSSERGITRAGGANLRINFLVARGEFGNLRVEGYRNHFSAFVVESVFARRSLRIQLPLQSAFAFEELWVNALANVGVGFDELFEQIARSRPLAGLQRDRIISTLRALLAHRHQQINVEVKTALYGTEERRAQVLAGHISSQRFSDVERLFDLFAGFWKI